MINVKVKQKFDVKEKALVCTTDQGANVVKAVRDSGMVHVSCFAHCLNTAVTTSLDSSEMLTEIRRKIRDLTSLTRRSSSVKEEFVNCQRRMGVTVKSLIQEVSTRWNATFLMLERALELKDSIILFFGSRSSRDLDSIEAEEWIFMTQSVNILRPAYEATVQMSGEKFVTASSSKSTVLASCLGL